MLLLRPLHPRAKRLLEAARDEDVEGGGALVAAVLEVVGDSRGTRRNVPRGASTHSSPTRNHIVPSVTTNSSSLAS
jgi:hypothetical protein